MSWCNVTCAKCGRTSSLETFTERPISGTLPAGQFQCPHCGYAFERRHGQPTVYPSGFVMPGPVSLAPIGARL